MGYIPDPRVVVATPDPQETLLSQLERRGLRGRTVSIHHLSHVQEEIESHHRQGLLDPALYQEYLAAFTFSPPDSLPQASTLIVVATPQPQIQVTFTWDGNPLPLIVPPTYQHARETDQQLEHMLAEILAPGGYRVAPAALPKKLLAVRSGLGAYGKNNICYVPGMGSFHRLAVFYSDLPCPQDDWQELQAMEGCQSCSACLRGCPTGAVTAGRFLLHAERCLTFHNEQASDVPFPSWIDPAWHNCLVGCMYCQKVCPENREFWTWVEAGAEFSEEETALLWQGIPLDQLPAATVQKLEQSDLVYLHEVLSRNLGVFVGRAR